MDLQHYAMRVILNLFACAIQGNCNTIHVMFLRIILFTSDKEFRHFSNAKPIENHCAEVYHTVCHVLYIAWYCSSFAWFLWLIFIGFIHIYFYI